MIYGCHDDDSDDTPVDPQIARQYLIPMVSLDRFLFQWTELTMAENAADGEGEDEAGNADTTADEEDDPAGAKGSSELLVKGYFLAEFLPGDEGGAFDSAKFQDNHREVFDTFSHLAQNLSRISQIPSPSASAASAAAAAAAAASAAASASASAATSRLVSFAYAMHFTHEQAVRAGCPSGSSGGGWRWRRFCLVVQEGPLGVKHGVVFEPAEKAMRAPTERELIDGITSALALALL
jgi:hypothetical protein